MLFSDSVQATSSVPGEGLIEFQGTYPRQVIDPEHPGESADPGGSPYTTGDLRIDYVPKFEFWKVKRVKTDQVYYGNAQLFHGNTGVRGNYIQLSDYRATGGGWTLQVRQETQFRNEGTINKELKGAVISLDKSWANSTSSSTAPLVSKEVIQMNRIGETYNLAEAKKGTGEGTWAIIFGATNDNSQKMKNTLVPKLDSKGNPVVDSNFENKPIYENTALSLSIPGATKKDLVTYQTVITWILSELP
ncbi:WxL domain-containing protein [Flavobacterium paronense]|nr:WxL domain-containing protein [Flavobacterium paronense]MDN3675927.1 WxL domain-containing protein [Flavobacterium paronense]